MKHIKASWVLQWTFLFLQVLVSFKFFYSYLNKSYNELTSDKLHCNSKSQNEWDFQIPHKTWHVAIYIIHVFTWHPLPPFPQLAWNHTITKSMQVWVGKSPIVISYCFLFEALAHKILWICLNPRIKTSNGGLKVVTRSWLVCHWL
jgi:hypothetical protein